jgi:polysaccharide biosynthesis/export protein
LLTAAIAVIVSVGLTIASAYAASPDYILHPGDQVAISVYGDQTLSETTVVLTDGSIEYPLIGKVKIGGYSLDAATQRITQALRKYVRDPDVSINVIAQGTENVLVLGNVKTPGKYTLPASTHITDAIAAAGGLGDTSGNYPDARFSVNNGPVQTVSLQALLRDGHLEENVPLAGDTIVYVTGPTPINVQVLGSVDRPGTVSVSTGDRLAIAIAKAGNTTNSHADLAHVHLSRTLPDGTTQTTEYNLYQALQQGNMTQDPVLHVNDVVFVPDAPVTQHASLFDGILGILTRVIFPF